MNNKIFICVLNHSIQGCNEAIKKEAYNLYNIFRNDIKYKNIIEFISFEPEFEKIEKKNNICYVPLNKASNFFKNNPPIIIHLFVPYLTNLFLITGIFNYQVIITLAGANPAQNLNKSQIEQIVHAIDMGNLYPVVESIYSEKKVLTIGCREIFKIYPSVNYTYSSKLKSLKNINDNKKVKIGFASSPFHEEDKQTRGIDIIKNIAKNNKDDIEFIILWRDPQIKFYNNDESNLSNIKLYNGYYDINSFYKIIDILILPYTTKTDTHAFPFSLLEAFNNNIPVICSDALACTNELKSFECAKIINFSNEYVFKSFNNIIKDIVNKKSFICNSAKKFIDESCNPKIYEEKYDVLYQICGTQIPSIGLNTWRILCKQSGDKLVKGIKNLKIYYENKKVTLDYSKQRFSEYPYNIINEKEQFEVLNSIKKHTSLKVHHNPGKMSSHGNKLNDLDSVYLKENELKLLDLSSGDGRMLKVLSKCGKTYALDNSLEMHNISSILNSNIEKKIIRILSDSMKIPLKDNSIDVVASFRFLRHFSYTIRKIIYKNILRILKPNGIFIFDAPNKNTENIIRYKTNWGSYNIYDIFYTDYTIASEMYYNNFTLLDARPVGENLLIKNNEPLNWIVTSIKNNYTNGLNSTLYNFFDLFHNKSYIDYSTI